MNKFISCILYIALLIASILFVEILHDTINGPSLHEDLFMEEYNEYFCYISGWLISGDVGIDGYSTQTLACISASRGYNTNLMMAYIIDIPIISFLSFVIYKRRKNNFN